MKKLCLTLMLTVLIFSVSYAQKSWTADNGNGTYTNPLFYDEFSDPDMIRVGDDFYLAGTTMHSTPGLVILHSKDLVNWEFMSYCFNSFSDLGLTGDQYSLNGKDIYGQGIWAPCIRYHDKKFYVFSNINGEGLQVFIADDPRGPWQHINMGGRIYDLSILFDDDGRVYAVHKYNEVHLTEIKPGFSGFIEDSDRVIIPAGNAMGEGHHIYKIDGKYYIISANYSPCGRMQCARADNIYGPYETVTISAEESLGTLRSHTANVGLNGPVPEFGFDYKIGGGEDNYLAAATLHQGGIVDLPSGEWWGFSMNDFRAVGRTTCLSPVTWVDGWPYFGLPNNLGRSPRTWTKPDVAASVSPTAPYERCDNFDSGTLLPIWQWNHDPDNNAWAIKKGKLNITSLPASDFLWAKNTLTQRCIGPVSKATVTLDTKALKDGDLAGLGLLNTPYQLIGIRKDGKKNVLTVLNQVAKEKIELPIDDVQTIYLRTNVNLDNEKSWMSYSTDGIDFTDIGTPMLPAYQMKTFQGPRFALFSFNEKGEKGGVALFDDFTVDEPMADRSGNLPAGKVISLRNLCDGSYAWANPHGMLHKVGAGSEQYRNQGCFFKVHDRGNGRVVLEAMNGTGYLTVVGAGLSSDVRLMENESDASLFMWQDMLRGQCMLMSMKTQRYIGIDPTNGSPYAANKPGCNPDRRDGTVFAWEEVESDGVVRKTESSNTY